mmetsp:Transcript_18657/g.57489  ORF Transcript_18657/g.57489 Transcript_18657/m.57489 type:complete len:141 (+) Transcript_18657:1134-1556(+)
MASRPSGTVRAGASARLVAFDAASSASTLECLDLDLVCPVASLLVSGQIRALASKVAVQTAPRTRRRSRRFGSSAHKQLTNSQKPPLARGDVRTPPRGGARGLARGRVGLGRRVGALGRRGCRGEGAGRRVDALGGGCRG